MDMVINLKPYKLALESLHIGAIVSLVDWFNVLALPVELDTEVEW